jgi:hypothetical protein
MDDQQMDPSLATRVDHLPATPCPAAPEGNRP